MELAHGKIEGKYKICLFTCGIIGIIFIFYSYIFLSQRAYIAELNSQVQLQQQRIKTIENFVLAHPDIDRYIAELDQTFGQANSALPDQINSSDFLFQLDQVAKSCDVQLLQIKPAPVGNRNGYRVIPIEINFRANFFQSMNFLTRLESMPRFNAVTSIAMQSQQDLVESKMVVVFYSYGLVAVPQSENQWQQQPVNK